TFGGQGLEGDDRRSADLLALEQLHRCFCICQRAHDDIVCVNAKSGIDGDRVAILHFDLAGNRANDTAELSRLRGVEKFARARRRSGGSGFKLLESVTSRGELRASRMRGLSPATPLVDRRYCR